MLVLATSGVLKLSNMSDMLDLMTILVQFSYSKYDGVETARATTVRGGTRIVCTWQYELRTYRAQGQMQVVPEPPSSNPHYLHHSIPRCLMLVSK